MKNLHQTLAELFTKTIKAHHHAFEEVDGHDPQWCEWYAEYIQDDFNQATGKDYSREQLTQLFIDANQAHLDTDPDSPWQPFYAQWVIDNHLAVGD